MFTSDVDSARYLIKRIEDFCAREQSSPYLADLRSEYLNTKGNIYVRVGRYGFGYCLLYRFLQTTFAGNEDRISSGYSYQSG